MFSRTTVRVIVVLLLSGALTVPACHADEAPLESPLQESSLLMTLPSGPVGPVADEARPEAPPRSIRTMLDGALELVGIRYRRGGSSPERGFDCSGFVGHVFHEGLGLYLPRSARELSKTGQPVAREELKPGDLVFFNTMRRAFSHVGIYLGDNRFLHAPRTGGKVRVEQIDKRYWLKRFNGARRVAD